MAASSLTLDGAALRRELTVAQQDQRDAALEHAQTVRLAGADVKDRVHADPSWQTLADLLTGDLELEHAGAIRVGTLLTSAPGIGPTKRDAMLAKAGVRHAPRRRLDDLSRRQRMNLAAEVLRNRRGRSDAALERFAQTRRHYYQRVA